MRKSTTWPLVVPLAWTMLAYPCLLLGRRLLGQQAARDAVVAVSAPARWYSRETAAMRRVHWALEQPHGRAPRSRHPGGQARSAAGRGLLKR